MNLDVVVVGAGPAGAVAGALLARAGHHVCVLDPLADTRRPIGETLQGPALALLKSSGHAPSAIHQPLHGSVACWGNDVPSYEDYLSKPNGTGLRLDRYRFDADLREWAKSLGTCFRRESLAALRTSGDGHVVATSTGRQLQCRWLIDASGRSAVVGRRMGSRYCTRGKLSSVYAELPGNAPAWSRTLVETAADGWWYATGLPGGNVLAAFQTDSGTARRLRHDPVEWLLRLRATQIVAASCMFDPAPQIVLSICDAGARHLEARFGASWLAIGDAAAAYDPVTSHGLYAAINDGIDGAAAVSQALTGSNRAVADFDDRRVARHRFVERQRLAAYARETRWPDAPFWASRRSA